MTEVKGNKKVDAIATPETPAPGARIPDVPDKEAENICGLLVHAKPARLAQVSAALKALPGTEIHQISDDGRFVVTVEDVDGNWAGDTMTQISNIKGVLSAALVYHQSAVDMDEAVNGEEISR